MALIFVLSGQPSDGQERGFIELLLRKLGHVTGYFLLTLSSGRALRELAGDRTLTWQLAASSVFSLAYAVTDEFHQTFVDGRDGTPVDVLIDAIGITLACFVVARRRG